jgi:exosortase family protein XrtG
MMSFGVGLLGCAWLAVTVFFRVYRIWLPYYILGSVGIAFWVILAGRELLALDRLLAVQVAYCVDVLASWVGVPTRTFDRAPGVLMVLVISQDVGWTMLQVGVESSGLLEIGVLTGLLSVYPGWSVQRRFTLIIIGVTLTMVANVLRVLVIVAMLHLLGKEALLLAHTFVGKVIFFVFMVSIYWFLITRPTIQTVGATLRRSTV